MKGGRGERERDGWREREGGREGCHFCACNIRRLSQPHRSGSCESDTFMIAVQFQFWVCTGQSQVKINVKV